MNELVDLYRIIDLGLAGLSIMVLAMALRRCMDCKKRTDEDGDGEDD